MRRNRCAGTEPEGRLKNARFSHAPTCHLQPTTRFGGAHGTSEMLALGVFRRDSPRERPCKRTYARDSPGER